jgi:hypothetical protein
VVKVVMVKVMTAEEEGHLQVRMAMEETVKMEMMDQMVVKQEMVVETAVTDKKIVAEMEILVLSQEEEEEELPEMDLGQESVEREAMEN